MMTVDCILAAALGTAWYLLFEIHLNFRGVEGVLLSPYVLTWLAAFAFWEAGRGLWPLANGRDRQPVSNLVRFFEATLLQLLVLGGGLFWLGSLNDHPPVWPPPVALIALQLAFAVQFILFRPWLERRQRRLFDFAAAVVLLIGSLVAVEGLMRGAGWIVLRKSAEPRATSLVPSRSTYKILCVGDSNTRGVGAPVSKSYPRQLQDRLEERYGEGRFQVVNVGVPGSNSSEIRLKFESQWAAGSFDAVLVLAGVNNMWSLKNAPQHILQQQDISRWRKLGRLLSDRFGGVRLVRLARLALLNFTAGSASDRPARLSPSLRNKVRTQVTEALNRLRTVKALDPEIDRFSPEEQKVFWNLTLPELLPGAPFAPLSAFVSDASSEHWTAREWTLYGWSVLHLSKEVQRFYRLKAFDAFYRATGEAPQSYWAWTGLAITAQNISPVHAQPLIEALAAKRPHDPIFFIKRMKNARHHDLRYHDQEIQARIAAYPDAALYAYYQAWVLLTRPDWDATDQWLEEHRERWGEAPWWSLIQGCLAVKRDNQDEAAEHFRHCLERTTINPEDSWAYIGRYLDVEDRPALAVRVLPATQAAALEDARVDRRTIASLTALGRWDEAIAYGERAAAARGEDPDLLYSLAEAYSRRRFHQGRQEDLQRAVELLEMTLAQGYSFRRVYARLYPLVPRQRLYALVSTFSRRYGVTIADEDFIGPPVDREAREEILFYDLDQIHREVSKTGGVMLVLNYPPRSDFEAVYRRFSEMRGVSLVDNAARIQALLQDAPKSDYFVPDGHPNARGYGEIAQEVFEVLVEQEPFQRWLRQIQEEQDAASGSEPIAM